VEYDGRDERLKREKFAGDRRRQADINDLSVEVRRFTPALRFGPDTLRPPKLQPLPTLAAQRVKKAA